MLRAAMNRRRGIIAGFALTATLAGCASYHALPLPHGSNLAAGPAALDLTLPADAPGTAPRKIDILKPLSIDEVGLLAILNDPDLKTERGEIGVARAGLLQATLLPNPSIGLGYAALLGGPGTTAAYTASLSQDIASIVTYHARVKVARAHLAQVNADLLWQEWQVAQKARLLALDIYWTDRSLGFTRHEVKLLANELTQVQAATRAGNLDLTALSPLLAAKAAADQSLATLDLNRLKSWQALAALLGLVPQARFAIAPPRLPMLPADIDPLIASLPQRRADLVALRLGYRSADENLRAAILGQFPAFVLGGSWNSDTTGVRSAGPNVTFDLPVFNRHQGQVAQARATRLLLRAQYQSRLDSAVGNIRGLLAQMRRVSGDIRAARQAASSAESLSRSAQRAYAQGNLDQRSLTDYETTALQREVETNVLQQNLGEDQITLAVELGLGLPQTRLADHKEEKRS